jgi:Na+-translocating ferredoxin:NAD+ oxidoreductase RnfG subunit
MKNEIIASVRHGLILSIAALLFGAFWAAYMATHHEQLHGAFEAQEEKVQQAQMKHLMKDMQMDSIALNESTNHSHAADAPANPNE